MISRRPKYYDKFKCIADKCTDSCCKGWEIDIDDETYSYYSNLKGDFGDKIRQNIWENNGVKQFKTDDCHRCPFLRQDNLCELILNIGEEHLCQICTDHPRFFNYYGKVLESGLGLCCEEAARLILTDDFTLTEEELPDDEYCNNEDFGGLFARRNDILQNPEKLYDSDSNSFRCDIAQLLDDIDLSDPIHEDFPSYVAEVKSSLETDMQSDTDICDDNIMNNIIRYFVYRYYIEGVCDDEVMYFLYDSIDIIGAFLRHESVKKARVLTLSECIDIVKLYSQEIEYWAT